MRIGHGYDVHAYTGGDHVMLGGVRIDAEFGVRAHSDGDVALHALCDALLGAAGLGDIGRWFPDTDPRWADADSIDLVTDVVRRVTAERWCPANADITIIAEKPRVRPHVDAMRERIGSVLGIPPGQVNVKATTHEGLGALGRAEGIAAHAVVLLARAPENGA